MNVAKFVRTPFLQNTTGRLLLIIEVSNINSTEGRIGKEAVNYDIKNKA